MSATNSGNQVISFDYAQPATSEGFNRGLLNLFPAGIFTGLEFSFINTTTIKLTIGVCFINDLLTPIGIRMETQDVSNNITPTTSLPYIVARFNWSNVNNNFVDFLPVEYSNPTDRALNYLGSGTEDQAKIMRDDIILGKVLFDGADVTGEWDYTRREIAYSYYSILKNEYFKTKTVETVAANDSKRIYVEGGVLSSSVGFQNIAGSKQPTANNQIENPLGVEDYIADTTDGRIDLVYINENGIVKFVLGVDGAVPSAPAYGNRKVIAEIRRGASRSTITGNEIFWINRDDKGTILTSSMLITDTYSLYTATNVDAALDEIANNAFTFNGLKKFSGNIYITTTSNPTLRLNRSDSATIYSDFQDQGSNSLYINKVHTADAKIRLNPLPGGNATGYVSMFMDTNTTGDCGLSLYKGDGTATIQILFGMDDLASYINNSASFGFWTNTPKGTNQLDINGNVSLHYGKFLGFNTYNDGAYKYIENGFAMYMLQTTDNFAIVLADTGNANAALTTPTTFLDFDWSDARMNFSKDFYTSANKIMFTVGTAITALAFNNGYSLIDVNEAGRDLVIKSGVGLDHNIIVGSGAGGSYISLSETGAGIKLALSSKAEGAAFTDDFYINLTQTVCEISGVDLQLGSLKLYFGLASNDYLIFEDAGNTFTFYADASNTASIVKAGSFDALSSIDLKHNIKKFNKSALELINSINIIEYNYKEDKFQRDRIGFIAEKTHSYFSTLKHDSFDITNSIGLLLKAIQELDNKVNNLTLGYNN